MWCAGHSLPPRDLVPRPQANSRHVTRTSGDRNQSGWWHVETGVAVAADPTSILPHLLPEPARNPHRLASGAAKRASVTPCWLMRCPELGSPCNREAVGHGLRAAAWGDQGGGRPPHTLPVGGTHISSHVSDAHSQMRSYEFKYRVQCWAQSEFLRSKVESLLGKVRREVSDPLGHPE